jgi:hypothetical protein
MQGLRFWGLSAALIAAGPPAAFADSQPPSPDQGTLLGKLFGPKPPKPGPTVRSMTPTVTAPLKPEVVANALRAEQEALRRRMEVCTELRRVALERGDDYLARQVDELERTAATLYYTRTAALGVPQVRTPLPEPMGASSLSDLAINSDTSAAAKAKKLTTPAAPAPGTTAQVREVLP